MEKRVLKGNVSAKATVRGIVEKATTMYVQELHFRSFLEFPAVGEADKLYISTDQNAVYRYDEHALGYVCIARDYSEIDTIQSGGIDDE